MESEGKKYVQFQVGVSGIYEVGGIAKVKSGNWQTRK